MHYAWQKVKKKDNSANEYVCKNDISYRLTQKMSVIREYLNAHSMLRESFSRISCYKIWKKEVNSPAAKKWFLQLLQNL